MRERFTPSINLLSCWYVFNNIYHLKHRPAPGPLHVEINKYMACFAKGVIRLILPYYLSSLGTLLLPISSEPSAIVGIYWSVTKVQAADHGPVAPVLYRRAIYKRSFLSRSPAAGLSTPVQSALARVACLSNFLLPFARGKKQNDLSSYKIVCGKEPSQLAAFLWYVDMGSWNMKVITFTKSCNEN